MYGTCTFINKRTVNDASHVFTTKLSRLRRAKQKACACLRACNRQKGEMQKCRHRLNIVIKGIAILSKRAIRATPN